MQLVKPKKLLQRGDTIVEVMIVLSVLGFALSIAYATANRSLQNTRQAQENSEAATLVQSQIEGVRTLSAISSPPVNQNIFITTPFCLDNSSGSFVVQPTSNPACTINQRYTIAVYYCGGSSPPLPGYSLTPCSAATTEDTFVATAVWSDVAGQGQDQVIMTYRAHP